MVNKKKLSIKLYISLSLGRYREIYTSCTSCVYVSPGKEEYNTFKETRMIKCILNDCTLNDFVGILLSHYHVEYLPGTVSLNLPLIVLINLTYI